MEQPSTLHSSAGSSHRTAAFTLIELLVVIAIIAILAAIAFPVFSKMQNRTRTVEAVSDMRNIKTAVASYYADNGKYPMTSGQEYGAQNGTTANNDTVFGNPHGYYRNSDLFNILRGVADDHYTDGNSRNPSQTSYWAGPTAKSATQPHSGITTQNVPDGDDIIYKGSLVDPWGSQYIIWLNVTRSGDLTGALGWFYHDYSPETDQNKITCGGPPLGVECASYGPDGDFGNKGNFVLKGSDDIVTWAHQ